jgi:hypothetical protein
MSIPSVKEFVAAFHDGLGSTVREDRHVDQLDDRYREPSHWVEGAVTCFEDAATIRDRHCWPITVAVEFFLKSSDRGYDESVKTVQELTQELSYVPPALTLYREGSEPWPNNPAFKQVMLHGRTLEGVRAQAFAQQWFDEDEQALDRRFWLISPPQGVQGG